MKKILLLLLLSAIFVQAQKPVATIRGEVNTKLPTNGANQVQAVKVREILSDVLDHIDTTNKRMYGKTIAQIRLINNTKYEIVFVLNSGKQGWFYYDSSDTSTSDDNQNTIVSANGRRYKRSVILAPVVSVNGKTGIVVLTKDDILGTIESADIAPGAVTLPKIQTISTQRILGRDSSGTGQVHQLTLTQLLDWASSTQGSVLYRGSSGWSALAPGTSGYFLKTNGAGNDPSWASTSIANNYITNAMLRKSAGLSVVGRSTNSMGDVSDITAANDGEVLRRNGTTLDFGQILTSGLTNGAVTYAKIQNIVSNQRVLGRTSGAGGVIEELSLSQMMDWTSSTRGSVFYRGSSGWAALGPGTSGQVLTTAGAGADPSWADVAVPTGSITYAKIQNISATQRLLGRSSAGAGVTQEVTTTTALDWVGSTQGSLLYRGASNWTAITPGTSGQLLMTQGSSANPTWSSEVKYLKLFLKSSISVTATGTTQGTALYLGGGNDQFITVSTTPSGSGVTLGFADAGAITVIKNNGANALKVYPSSTTSINSLAADAPVTVNAGSSQIFISTGISNVQTILP